MYAIKSNDGRFLRLNHENECAKRIIFIGTDITWHGRWGHILKKNTRNLFSDKLNIVYLYVLSVMYFNKIMCIILLLMFMLI